MKKLKIQFADVGNNGNVNRLIEGILSKEWEFELCKDPDYLFCGDYYTYEFLNYDCIKILVNGENEYPNLNTYDYTIGTNDFQFRDRYIRWPFYLWRDGTRKEFDMACQKHKNIKTGTRKFCNFVVSNGQNADLYRTELFEQLNKYKRVDSGGRYLNNLGYFVGDKLSFMRDYKFTIACENSTQKGYITEKIVEAWASGTIPIYWGGVDIADEFNEKAFINCMNCRNIEEVVEKVKEIDQSEELYFEMLREPILSSSSNAVKFLDDTPLIDFFRNIFEQPKEQARRIARAARSTDDTLRNLLKINEYYKILDRWNNNEEKGQHLADIQIVKQAERIVVYGLGVLGKRLVKELTEWNKTVEYIIDRNDALVSYRGINICSLQNINLLELEKKNKKQDLIIITVRDGERKIEREIYDVFPCAEIVNLKTLIGLAD